MWLFYKESTKEMYAIGGGEGSLPRQQGVNVYTHMEHEPHFITETVEEDILLPHERIMDAFAYFLHNFVFLLKGRATIEQMTNGAVAPVFLASDEYRERVQFVECPPEGKQIQELFGELLNCKGTEDEHQAIYKKLAYAVIAYSLPRQKEQMTPLTLVDNNTTQPKQE